LKELESNFICINKNGDNLLIEFHNPSIRDFLSNYIRENSQVVRELIISGIYFEQIVRLWGSIFESDESIKTTQMLAVIRKDLGDAVKRLLRSKDCRLKDFYEYSGHHLIVRKVRETVPLEARALYALDVAYKLGLNKLSDWVFTALVNQFSVGMHRPGLNTLLGHISKKGISPPKRFLEAVKELLLKKLGDLDDFESAIVFTRVLPENIAECELDSIRNEFESSYEQLVDKLSSNESDPDTLREYADKLKDLGEDLGIDVEYEYDLLRDQATENEEETNEDDPKTFDSWRGAASEVERTEDEIHSMFDSLR
jgi:hypothetical protein